MSPGASGRDGVGALLERQASLGAEHGELHGRPGALRFGDPDEEHAVLRESAGVADGRDRALMEVRGERAREVFGGLVTQHVEALAEGRAAYAFLLTARGRPVADLRVVRLPPAGGEERLLLDLPTVCREGTEEHLGRYLPPRLARFGPRDDLLRLSAIGPAADKVLGDAGGTPPGGPLESGRFELPGSGTEVVVVRREPVTAPGHDLYVPVSAAADLWSALVESARSRGGGPVGLQARETLRVELGIPLYGREISLEVLPQETGQTGRAVSFEKGCYTGQEVVARIHYRGKVNTHLRGLRLPAGDALPERGVPVFEGERERGSVTTAVRSPREGPIALAYVRREVDPGSEVALGAPDGPPAGVVELPISPVR